MLNEQSPKLFAERLGRHDATLREGLRATLIDRSFPPHPRLRGQVLPLDPEGDALCGVRVVYTFGDFVPLACGMSRAASWKCGARRLLDLVDCSLVGEDEDCDSLHMELVERWIRAAWLDVRTCAPDLLGFVSEHDTIFMTDLDTGSSIRADQIDLGYL